MRPFLGAQPLPRTPAERFIRALAGTSAPTTPSPACGRRWREAPDEGKPPPHHGNPHAAAIVATTLSRLRKMSRFQKRRTLYPFFVNQASRWLSLVLSPCCPPSASTINRCSTQRKSAMYGPTGACLRNLTFCIRRSRNVYQSLRSASVGLRRIARARFFADKGISSRIDGPHVRVLCQSSRLPLTPTLSRKRERGRAEAVIRALARIGARNTPSPACGRRWREGPDEGKPRPHPNNPCMYHRGRATSRP